MTTGQGRDWFPEQSGAPPQGPQFAPPYGSQPLNPYANPYQAGFGTPGYRPPGYATPGYGTVPRNGMGIAALVLGGLALVFSWTILGGFIFGVLGIVFAVMHKARVRQQRATGPGMGVAAIAMSIIGIAISAVLVAVGAWLFGTRSENYLDCVNKADGNQQQIRACVDRYLSNP